MVGNQPPWEDVSQKKKKQKNKKTKTKTKLSKAKVIYSNLFKRKSKLALKFWMAKRFLSYGSNIQNITLINKSGTDSSTKISILFLSSLDNALYVYSISKGTGNFEIEHKNC